MAVTKEGDGRYRTSDGTLYNNEIEAHDAEFGGPGGGPKGGSGGAMGGLAGGFLLIFIIGPIIAAKLIGWLFGMILKLGIVGKIITTAIMIVAGLFMVIVPMSFAAALFRNMGSTASYILASATIFIIPAWYYFWHYDVVKVMGPSVFSNKIKNLAMFVWFGGIGGIILSFFKGGGEIMAAIISLGATIAGFAYYFLSTRSYAQEVERTKSFKFRWIGLAVAAGLTTAVVIQNVVEHKISMQESAAEREAKMEITQATFPAGITVIEDSAYYETGLTSVIIPEGVTDIGNSAFSKCKNLTSVTLPRSLERIGTYAFYDCTSLVNVTIPSGHTIQYGQFYGRTFEAEQPDYFGSFMGCPSLSAASRQAIEDSGYTGKF
jgi:hypothetical protein